MRFGLKLAAAFAVALTLAAAHAEKISERSRQKRAAEASHTELQQKLSSLTRDIQKTESAKGHAADALAHSEAAISGAKRGLHELAQKQQQIEDELNQLAQRQAELEKKLDAQQRRLATLLREQRVRGNADRIKLLLSGDNPNRINRELQYMGYLSRAEARLIENVRAGLREVEAGKARAQEAKLELEQIAQDQREKMAQLGQEQGKRAALLAELSAKLAAQRKEAGNLQRDQKRMANLVERLSKLIEEQRKAEAAQAEQRRQQLARAKAEREKRRALQPKSGRDDGQIAGAANPNAIDSDEDPQRLPRQNEPSIPQATQIDSLQPAFKSLHGQLRLPVKGELIAKYGSKRGDAPSSKGLFIRAAEGSEVKAIAAGRVVFADWLRGFGNLIIVDHGAQYLSIYGNNQAVLKHAGDVVKSGDVIASAGNSGGSEQSGLYFELRFRGQAFDPLEWMSSR